MLFSKSEVKSDIILRKGGKIPSCIACKLYKSGCTSPKMEPQGKGGKKILLVLDSPTRMEDANGEYLRGKGGGMLKTFLKGHGIDAFEDCLITSSVRCMPDSDTTITNFHTDSCRQFLMRTIGEFKPKLVLAFGKNALMGVLGNTWEKDVEKIEQWRGFTIPDQKLKTFIAPLYSVDALTNEKAEQMVSIFQSDLNNALSCLTIPFPVWKQPNITILKNLKVLKEIKPLTLTAFDYEATGLKPHAPGHKILSASIAVSPDDVYAFKMPTTEEKREPFIWYLRNSQIKKMAHNLKYEEAWSFNILGVRVKNWYWDSMIAAHILDNRRGITNLKFQGYVHFGIENYNIEVDKYIKGIDPDNANSMNRLEEFSRSPRNLEFLLEYNALDSIVEYRLAIMQQELINKHLLPF